MAAESQNGSGAGFGKRGGYRSGIASVLLTSISSNASDRDPNDIEAEIGSAAASFRLRAKKSRVYTITYIATDKAVNQTVRTIAVTVPHDQSEPQFHTEE
ncbi:hypothetical protein [Paenibacillus sp. FSL W8-0194]|uniref:hypothetical protein n=1 Tax=Paenibacillus sp. FSL W8-0194 TaxID=2921711 RepID=UPI0030DD0A09